MNVPKIFQGSENMDFHMTDIRKIIPKETP